jgi:hypothetical protein
MSYEAFLFRSSQRNPKNSPHLGGKGQRGDPKGPHLVHPPSPTISAKTLLSSLPFSMGGLLNSSPFRDCVTKEKTVKMSELVSASNEFRWL